MHFRQALTACAVIAAALLVVRVAFASGERYAVTSSTGPSIEIDAGTGGYSIEDHRSGWIFSGSVAGPMQDVTSTSGVDKLGSYTQLAFQWKQNVLLDGFIRSYSKTDQVMFGISAPDGDPETLPDFPDFKSFPRNLHILSYVDDQFDAPIFQAVDSSTPWLMFDDSAHTVAISPAANFLIAQMNGDGISSIGSGLIGKIVPLPVGFAHQTIMVFGQGVENTFQSWGDALTTLGGKPTTQDNADRLIKYFGYWTDNGAYYYYNYNKSLGYAGTIRAVKQHYQQAKIPLGYVQLDSWWYQKSSVSYDGSPAPGRPYLPQQSWNYFGGTIDYTASPDLFPNGLGSFQQQLGLPLAVHARWLDPAGPYAQQYKLSGVAAIDPRWWDACMAYLKANGVFCFEQDWLSDIYFYTPDMATTLSVATEFADNMARAAAANGLTIQYCMPTPRFLLQGSRYANLTTTRASGDRFGYGRFNNFLYASMLDNALHIRPWTDVFNSTELANLTVSVLSSGPVGIGDEMGSESRDNIMLAARADGVLVKPDTPLLPTDASILSDARGEHRPLIASTFTDHGQRTEYVFAYARPGDSRDVSFTPSDLGMSGEVYIYDGADRVGKLQNAMVAFTDTLSSSSWALYEIAPVGRSGIALLGDSGKIVATGRQRIVSLNDQFRRMTVSLIVSSNEPSILLHGYAAALPAVTVKGGTASAAEPGLATGEFTTTIVPGADATSENIDDNPVKAVTVELTER